jgi:hypothetical protein
MGGDDTNTTSWRGRGGGLTDEIPLPGVMLSITLPGPDDVVSGPIPGPGSAMHRRTRHCQYIHLGSRLLARAPWAQSPVIATFPGPRRFPEGSANELRAGSLAEENPP